LRTVGDRRTLPWIIVIGVVVATVGFSHVSPIRRMDELRVMEFKLDFNENYAKKMETRVSEKDYAPCVPLFEAYFESTPDWLNDMSGPMLVSPNMRAVAKFFGDAPKVLRGHAAVARKADRGGEEPLHRSEVPQGRRHTLSPRIVLPQGTTTVRAWDARSLGGCRFVFG
jgi:hypothetical protein